MFVRRSGYRLGHLAGALQLNPAGSRIVGGTPYPAGPFRNARALPEIVNIAGPSAVRRIPFDTMAPADLPRPQATTPEYQLASANVRDELKYANFNNLPISVANASARYLLKPSSGSRRVYLFIVNTHAAQVMYLTFAQDSSATIGVPIAANNGFFEFNNVVPQDDVFLFATGAATTGVIMYANDNLIGINP